MWTVCTHLFTHSLAKFNIVNKLFIHFETEAKSVFHDLFLCGVAALFFCFFSPYIIRFEFIAFSQFLVQVLCCVAVRFSHIYTITTDDGSLGKVKLSSFTAIFGRDSTNQRKAPNNMFFLFTPLNTLSFFPHSVLVISLPFNNNIYRGMHCGALSTLSLNWYGHGRISIVNSFFRNRKQYCGAGIFFFFFDSRYCYGKAIGSANRRSTM